MMCKSLIFRHLGPNYRLSAGDFDLKPLPHARFAGRVAVDFQSPAPAVLTHLLQ